MAFPATLLTTPGIEYSGEVLPDANLFDLQNSALTVLCIVSLIFKYNLGAGGSGQRVYHIIHIWANKESPDKCAEFVQLLHFECLQVETGTSFQNIFGRYGDRNRGGEGSARF